MPMASLGQDGCGLLLELLTFSHLLHRDGKSSFFSYYNTQLSPESMVITILAYKSVVLNLGPPDVIELQLPEAFTTTSAGQDFWELKSKNIWRPKVGDHCYKS